VNDGYWNLQRVIGYVYCFVHSFSTVGEARVSHNLGKGRVAVTVMDYKLRSRLRALPRSILIGDGHNLRLPGLEVIINLYRRRRVARTFPTLDVSCSDPLLGRFELCLLVSFLLVRSDCMYC